MKPILQNSVEDLYSVSEVGCDSTVTGDCSVSFIVSYINYAAYIVFGAHIYISSIGIYMWSYKNPMVE